MSESAWKRAEVAAFEAVVKATGAVEGTNAFRGRMPTIINAFYLKTGGGGVSSSDPESVGCYGSMQLPGEIRGYFESRDRGQDFAGLILEWLQDTQNAKTVDEVLQYFRPTSKPAINEVSVIMDGRETPVNVFELTWTFEMAFNLRT